MWKSDVCSVSGSVWRFSYFVGNLQAPAIYADARESVENMSYRTTLLFYGIILPSYVGPAVTLVNSLGAHSCGFVQNANNVSATFIDKRKLKCAS